MTTVALAITLSALASAQSNGFPVSTDRGTAFSNSSSVVPMGRWQVEGGFTYNCVGGITSETFGEFAIRYPVHARLELRLNNLSIGRVLGSRGLVDPAVGFKYRLAEGSARHPEVSVIIQTTIPVGVAAFRVTRTQPTVQLPWFLQLDPTTGVGGMLSAADLGPNGARFTQYGTGVYLSRALDPKTTGYLEVYGIAPLRPGGPNGGFIDGCLTYLVSSSTQLDFRYGTGFNQNRDGWFIGAGVGYRF